MEQQPSLTKHSYPVYFYILDNGTWLIESPIPFQVGVSWVHVSTLLPFMFGFTDQHEVKDDNLEALKKRIITKCEITFEYSMDLKQVARMLNPIGA
jgi:hypothetical protein